MNRKNTIFSQMVFVFMVHTWLKGKLANLSQLFWIKASEHTPCEICQNYQVEEEQPFKIIPLFEVSTGIEEVRQRKQQS